MTALLLKFGLPLAVEIVKFYIDSSDTKKDDKVLEVVQKGASYLAPKENNTLDVDTKKLIDTCVMKVTQKAKD